MGNPNRAFSFIQIYYWSRMFPSKRLIFIGVLTLYVVTGFGNQCSKDICNKCTTVARQADRQEVVAKRYNAYHSDALNELSFLVKLRRRLNGCCTKFRDSIFLCKNYFEFATLNSIFH